MKKLFAWLTGGVIKEIGNVIDNLSTSKEEKLIIKKQIQQILEDADNNAQIQVTERWKSDMNSDSFLSKNIRPKPTPYCNTYKCLCHLFTILIPSIFRSRKSISLIPKG